MNLATPEKNEKKLVRTLNTFYGQRGTQAPEEGYLSDAKDLSFDAFPALKSAAPIRKAQGLPTLVNPLSIGADEKLYYNDGSNFIYDGVVRYSSLSVGKKSFVPFDGRVLIFPDRIAYSHKTRYYFYAYNKLSELTEPDVLTSIVELSAISATAPENALEGDKYYNTSDNKIYTLTNNVWYASSPSVRVSYAIKENTVEALQKTYIFGTAGNREIKFKTTDKNGDYGNTHIKISFYRDSEPTSLSLTTFKVGDKVSFRGIHTGNAEANVSLSALANGTTITAIHPKYMLVENTGGAVDISIGLSTQVDEVMMIKVIPPLSFARAIGNRVWGAVGNTIYACAPNDPFNWNVNDGAYAIKADTLGDIIGCAQLSDTPIFFTEDAIIRVNNVQGGCKLSVIPSPGLTKSTLNSVAYVAGSLFYLSSYGLMRYSGGVPKKVETSGIGDFTGNIIGASDGARYYLSCNNKLYVYDVASESLSYRDVMVIDMSAFENSIVLIGKYLGESGIFVVDNNINAPSALYPNALFLPWDTDILKKKTYKRLYVQLKAELGKNVYIRVKIGDNTYYDFMLTGTGEFKLYKLDLKPTRSDSISVNVYSQYTAFTLNSISREFTVDE